MNDLKKRKEKKLRSNFRAKSYRTRAHNSKACDMNYPM